MIARQKAMSGSSGTFNFSDLPEHPAGSVIFYRWRGSVSSAIEVPASAETVSSAQLADGDVVFIVPQHHRQQASPHSVYSCWRITLILPFLY